MQPNPGPLPQPGALHPLVPTVFLSHCLPLYCYSVKVSATLLPSCHSLSLRHSSRQSLCSLVASSWRPSLITLRGSLLSALRPGPCAVPAVASGAAGSVPGTCWLRRQHLLMTESPSCCWGLCGVRPRRTSLQGAHS